MSDNLDMLDKPLLIHIVRDLRKVVERVKTERDGLLEAAEGFMAFVTWEEGDNPGYPLDLRVRESLISLRDILERMS